MIHRGVLALEEGGGDGRRFDSRLLRRCPLDTRMPAFLSSTPGLPLCYIFPIVSHRLTPSTRCIRYALGLREELMEFAARSLGFVGPV